MAKKWCWGVIFFTIAINVIMLQWTTRAYMAREYDSIFLFTIVGVVMAAIAFITYLLWKKEEYKHE